MERIRRTLTLRRKQFLFDVLFVLDRADGSGGEASGIDAARGWELHATRERRLMGGANTGRVELTASSSTRLG